MKHTKILKISLLVLSLALILGAVFAMSTGAESTGPEIISQNMAYSNEFKIMYAVDAASVPSGGAVTLKIYTKDPSIEASTPVATMTVAEPTPAAENGNLNKDAYIFITETGVSYADMTLNFFAQAEANGVKGAVKRYSVAEYFYEKLADTTIAADKRGFYQETIGFGAGIQKYVTSPAVTGDALISNLRYVVVEGGKIDGYSAGLYPIGSIITPIADTETTEKWAVAVLYDDDNKTVTNDITSFTVIDAAKTTFTLGYKEPPFAINYREGTQTFDNYTAGSMIKPPVKVIGELVSDNPIHKTALKLSINEQIAFTMALADVTNATNNGISAADATGVEISFDIKAARFNPNGKNDQAVKLMFGTETTINSSSKEQGVRIYPRDSGTTTKAYIGRYELSGGDSNAYVDSIISAAGAPAVDTSKWFHFRMVQFSGNDNIYVYINNVLVRTFSGSVFSDINSILSFSIQPEYSMDIYLDNLFFGYITDEAPAN